MSDAPNNITQLLTACIAPFQDAQDTLVALLAERTIDTAVGAQLDVLGRIVGEDRAGFDDDTYRRYIRARIAVNRSRGVTEDVINVLVSVIADGSAVIETRREGVATLVAYVNGIALDGAVAAIAALLTARAVSAGVRLVTEWSQSIPANTFRLDTGPGLDVGHLAGAIDNS